MAESDVSQVSVVAATVFPRREREFLTLIGELHALIRGRGYGADQLLQDAGDLRVYYDVCTWASQAAAERCHSDPDVQDIWSRLKRLIRLRHLVGVAWPVDATQVLASGPRLERRARADRRAGVDRRSAGDRRRQDLGPRGRERRRRERRLGDRRQMGVGRRLPADRLVPGAGPEPAELASAGPLLAAARAARSNAHAPFSQFRVGAALETVDGTIVTGCNIENATYGLTLCAERVAMFKAMSEGHRRFTRVTIVADTVAPTPPCGACRQILWEFGGNLEVILGDLSEEKSRYWLSQLLPLPFEGRLLHRDLI